MSDSAFPTADYPAFTLAQLRQWIADNDRMGTANNYRNRILTEIARREAVAAGDVSAMTPGEQLRHEIKLAKEREYARRNPPGRV
jgi:hypothetical protein